MIINETTIEIEKNHTLDVYRRCDNDITIAQKYLFSALEISDNEFFQKLWDKCVKTSCDLYCDSYDKFGLENIIITEFCDIIIEAIKIMKAFSIRKIQ